MKRILAILQSMKDAYFHTKNTDYDFNNWVAIVGENNFMFKNFLLNVEFNTHQSLVQFRYNGYCIYHKNLYPTNSIFRECRSVVIDLETMEFVITPFAKFFNYNEIPAENITDESKTTVMEKLDGSLAMMTIYKNDIFVATSKCLVGNKTNRISKIQTLLQTSETKWLKLIQDMSEYTILAELIGYDNTHVVQYEKELELRLIGIRKTKTGEMLLPQQVNQIAQKYDVAHALIIEATVAELLERRLHDKTNIEGWIVIDEQNRRMKIKTTHYCSMHTVLLGRGHANAIIDYLAKGTIDDLIGSLTPDAAIILQPVIDKAIQNGAMIQDYAMFLAKQIAHLSKKEQHDWIESQAHTIRPAIRQALYKDSVDYVFKQVNGKVYTFAEIQEKADLLQQLVDKEKKYE